VGWFLFCGRLISSGSFSVSTAYMSFARHGETPADAEAREGGMPQMPLLQGDSCSDQSRGGDMRRRSFVDPVALASVSIQQQA